MNLGIIETNLGQRIAVCTGARDLLLKPDAKWKLNGSVCKPKVAIAKFWRNVRSDNPNGCWNWPHSKNEKGYGMLRYCGKVISSHRLAWTLTNGPIPEGMMICHRCDNPSCCNPRHLFIGTAKDNFNDCLNKKRFTHRGESHTSAKLTERAVIEIRRQHASGQRIAQIARQYDVSAATISQVIHGRSWRHVCA